MITYVRRRFIGAEFPSERAFQQFEAEREGIHELREAACTDDIWTLDEPWELRKRARRQGSGPRPDS